MREQRDAFAELKVAVVAVGFSPAPALAELANHLDWPWAFLSDPERSLYHRLALGRAENLRQIFNPGTRRRYRAAVARGAVVARPVEDVRQLGGDAIVRAGTVVKLWRPSSPDERPSVGEIMAAVRAVADSPQ